MVIHKTQFIYFDVGGVIILDYSKTNKWNEMLADLGISDQQKPGFEKLFDEHESKICVGEDINVFVREAEEKLGIVFPKDYDMTQDFVGRFEINPAILNLLKKLQGQFKLGLLTAQYPNMLNLIFKRELIPANIKWDVVIDSSIEGITKPDPAIYDLAEKRAGVAPHSIMFIDNKASLLEIPKQRGWKTFEYDPAEPEASAAALESFILEN